MKKKYDRALYGPSWTEVIFGAVLSVLLGAVLAAAFFVFKPVMQVKELPKEPVAGVIYYIEGSHDSAKARRLAAKQKIFAQGGSVVLVEDELNTLVAPAGATPPPPPPPAPGKKPAPAPKPAPVAPPPATPAGPAEMVSAGIPNFRIKDGVLQISVPVQVKVALVGLDETVLVLAKGGFAKQGDTFVFTPQSVHVGSCPVERLPMAVDFLIKKFLHTQSIPEPVATAWGKLAEVKIEGSMLRLTMP